MALKSPEPWAESAAFRLTRRGQPPPAAVAPRRRGTRIARRHDFAHVSTGQVGVRHLPVLSPLRAAAVARERSRIRRAPARVRGGTPARGSRTKDKSSRPLEAGL